MCNSKRHIIQMEIKQSIKPTKLFSKSGAALKTFLKYVSSKELVV